MGDIARWAVVPGTPRWAVVAAWATLACVVPSCVWRTAVGLGVALGWSEEQLRLQRIPGSGTIYVISLSIASLVAAGLTLGLIYRWGERVPPAVPAIGGRRVPILLAAGLALCGVGAVATIMWLSIVNWSQVSGFADQSPSGWSALMVAAYAPAILWAPLLLAVTIAYVRRRINRAG